MYSIMGRLSLATKKILVFASPWMLESSYNMLFGKLALRCLFEDYFDLPRHFSTRTLLKPLDDPHVDLIATVSFWALGVEHMCLVSGPLVHMPEENVLAKAQFRWQRASPKDYGILGLRYGSENLSIGTTVTPFCKPDEYPRSAWLVSKMGRLTAGLQYEPQCKFSASRDLVMYRS
ncbi:hypothetical protein Cgig2_001001 [Carnegiea gigantea]|uniref:Uncharacterized protein n=1 Tax=Carnegiea gigantea TaxID=171969 RepID=A0A9Q1GU42_9CARY|nr:hypothetical protein Cgig2_001001 [Carnegiea gigantea]